MEKIDLTYLETLADGSTELIVELMEIFIDQVPEFIEEMNTYYLNKDWEALSAIAHKSKSSIDIVGLKDLQAKLKQLELDAKEGLNEEAYRGIIDEFISTCNNAIIDAKEVIKNLQ